MGAISHCSLSFSLTRCYIEMSFIDYKHRQGMTLRRISTCCSQASLCTVVWLWALRALWEFASWWPFHFKSIVNFSGYAWIFIQRSLELANCNKQPVGVNWWQFFLSTVKGSISHHLALAVRQALGSWRHVGCSIAMRVCQPYFLTDLWVGNRFHAFGRAICACLLPCCICFCLLQAGVLVECITVEVNPNLPA